MTSISGEEGLIFSLSSTPSLYTLDNNPASETILASLAST